MALKTVLETTEGLDESIAQLYTENDGKFVLAVEGVDEHPDVANLKNAYERVKLDREAARKERDEYKAKAGGIPEDFDAEKWSKLKDGKPDEAALIKLRKELEAERDEWKGKFETATETARKNALDRDLTDALTAAGVTNPAFAKAARTMIAGNVRIDEQGNPFVETDMGPLNLAEHVKRWTSGEGKDFVTAPKGGGSKGGDGTVPSKKWNEMTSGEKTRLFRENPQEYERLKSAA